MLISLLRSNFGEILNEIPENAYENVAWKISATLSRPQCVKEVYFLSQCFNNLLKQGT